MPCNLQYVMYSPASLNPPFLNSSSQLFAHAFALKLQILNFKIISGPPPMTSEPL